MEDLNILRDKVHANALERGLWEESFSDKYRFLLVIKELCEAVEAKNRGKKAQESRFLYETDLLTPDQIYMWEYHYSITIGNTIPDKLAGALLCALDIAGSKSHKVAYDEFELQMRVSENSETFEEQIHSIVSSAIFEDINGIVMKVVALSMILGIDLQFYVTHKMKYNSLCAKKK